MILASSFLYFVYHLFYEDRTFLPSQFCISWKNTISILIQMTVKCLLALLGSKLQKIQSISSVENHTVDSHYSV